MPVEFSESCSCGASIYVSYDTESLPDELAGRLTRFRTAHLHEMGIKITETRDPNNVEWVIPPAEEGSDED